eukprot:2094507-Ditylum_brightwellii.AAC.1
MRPTYERRTLMDLSIPSVNVSLTPGTLARIMTAWPHFEFMLIFLKNSWQSMVSDTSVLASEQSQTPSDFSGDWMYGMDFPLQSTSMYNYTLPYPPYSKRDFHLSGYLDRFACKMEIAQGAFEAHLVSVKHSLSSLSGEPKKSILQVGWAWILDDLEHDRGKKVFLSGLLPNFTDPLANLDSFNASVQNMPTTITVDIVFFNDDNNDAGNNTRVTLLVQSSEIFIHWYPDT